MYTLNPIERLITVDSIVMGIDAVRPENYYFPGELHDFWEAVYVADGEATATADERVYRLNSGKLVFHKPMEFHRIWTADTTAHLYIISFKAEGDVMEKFKNGYFELETAERERFIEITAQFIKAAKFKETDYIQYCTELNLAACMLETFLIKLSVAHNRLHRKPKYNEIQYQKIVRVMKDNCETALTVGDLASLCNMSISNMKRIFGIFSDKGIAKYYQTIKMRRAMELLDEGVSAKNVADRLAFSEINYFYTVFKRETGKTVAEYRRKGMNND